MTFWRLVLSSWTLLCLCWQDSQAVHLIPMCGNSVSIVDNSSLSAHRLKASSQSRDSSSRTSGTRFVILSYHPPDKLSRKEGMTPRRVKKSVSLVIAAVTRKTTSQEHYTRTNQSIGKGRPMTSTVVTSRQRVTDISHSTKPYVSTSDSGSFGQTTPSIKKPSTLVPATCVCDVRTSAGFSLYIIEKSPSDLGVLGAGSLQIGDGCNNSTLSWDDLKDDKVIDFQSTSGNGNCPDKSPNSSISIRVTDRVTGMTNLRLLLLLAFEESTDNVTVACGGGQKATGQKNLGQVLPDVKVLPRHSGNDKTDDVMEREQPAGETTRSSQLSSSTLHLMILSFVCLVLLMLATGFCLLWRRSVLDYHKSFIRRKKSQKKDKQEHNYEEISEVYSQQISQYKKDTLMCQDIQRQISTGSTWKTDMTRDSHYEDSGPRWDREYSPPDARHNVFSVEYSTTKDAVTIKSRPQLSIPSTLDGGIASYEDLPYRHRPDIQISLAADKMSKITRSLPEIPSICKSNCRESKNNISISVSGLPAAAGCRFHRSKSYWPSRDSAQSGSYFELQRSYDSGPLDVSKVVLYDSALNTGPMSCDSTCSSRHFETRRGDGDGRPRSRSDYRKSGDVSEGSISMQAEEDHTYEDITSEVERRENPSRGTLKPRVPVQSNSCIIDLSEINKNRRFNTGARSSLPSVALLSNALNTARYQDHDGECQNPKYSLSEDASKQMSLSIPNPIPPADAIIMQSSINNFCHDHDDGSIMIENDIYQSSKAAHSGEEGQVKDAPNVEGSGSDSGVILDDDHEERPCPSTTKAKPTDELAVARNCHTVMRKNSIYKSSGKIVGMSEDDLNGPLMDVTVCDECDGNLVMVENTIYNSQQL